MILRDGKACRSAVRWLCGLAVQRHGQQAKVCISFYILYPIIRPSKAPSRIKPFEYSFLDEQVALQYQAYQRWMRIMGLSTVFAILISCLGLFGLTGTNVVNRTKEIGIRKVLGSGLLDLFVLLNRPFWGFP